MNDQYAHDNESTSYQEKTNKATMRCHYTLIRMTEVKMIDNIKFW